MLRIVLLALILASASLQECRNKYGKVVEWWIVLKVPPKIGSHDYGYFDSMQQTADFTLQTGRVDEGSTALTKTLQSANDSSFYRIAWNDQNPNGSTTSSNAHSKGMIVANTKTKRGFFLSHSIPKYPAFIDGMVIANINLSQQVFGQHLSCFYLPLSELEIIASKLMIIRPNVYEAFVQNTTDTLNLFKLAKRSWITSTQLFTTMTLTSAYGYNINSIFKNAKLNGSIFEDGLPGFLGQKNLVTQTWGRPLQPIYCTCQLKVLNILKIKLGNYAWNQSDDHSKWAISKNYACFGDMNHMSSQWTRGGAFHCFKNQRLVEAVTKLITSVDVCPLDLSCSR